MKQEGAIMVKKLQNLTNQFDEVINLIEKARHNALKSVNIELINLYWKIGQYISKKLQTSEWGESIVEQLAEYIKKRRPDIKGYTKRSLYRMRQFFEIYSEDKRVSALLTQISWTNHLLILSKSKTPEEREFYLNLCIKEKYSSRELERQIDSGFYERSMISNKKISPVMRKLVPNAEKVFKDTYILNFLDLPEPFDEKEFRKSIVKNFKNFVLEFGKDFAFLGEKNEKYLRN